MARRCFLTLVVIALGVSPSALDEHGAVSEVVALQMAEGARKRCDTGFAIAVTGIAGPSGGTESKPVGTVFIALADGNEPEVLERRMPGDPERIRLRASFTALDPTRRKLV